MALHTGEPPMLVHSDDRKSRYDSATLVDLLRWRAARDPDGPALTFVSYDTPSTTRQTHLTYGDLQRRALAVGAALTRFEVHGEPVVISYPAGLTFATAFFGALYAGAIPVPLPVPHADRQRDRFTPILDDCRPRLVLGNDRRLTPSRPAGADGDAITGDEVSRPAWLDAAAVPDEAADGFVPVMPASTALAYLQYTSGSTANPKGVMVTHANVLANLAHIDQGFAHTSDSVIVSWLPHFHDMGLIYGIFQPIYQGIRGVLMSPAAFVQRPSRWLQVMSDWRATHSGGPNFGYDLCVRHAAEALPGLRLDAWRVAFSGGEAVRARTLRRFADTFAGYGFAPRAFYPAYGLAEATLKVTGGPVKLSSEAAPATAAVMSANERSTVTCGRPSDGTDVVIVEPGTGQPQTAAAIGEVWVAGPSVALGYWNRPDDTARTFQASLPGHDRPFLRTGDLGFLDDDGLTIVGRLKDLVIVRGQNYHPEDLELTIDTECRGIRPGCGVAFSIDGDGYDRLAIVYEIERHPSLEPAAIADGIRAALASWHGLRVPIVALVKTGAVPRTTSGKLQRHAARTAYLDGTLIPVFSSVEELDAAPPATVLAVPPVSSGDRDDRETLVLDALRTHAADVLGRSALAIDVDLPVGAIGLDSIGAVQLQHRIAAEYDVTLSLDHWLGDASLRAIAAAIVGARADATDARVLTTPAADAQPGPFALSDGQRALWYVQQVTPDSAAYHLTRAARVHGPVDPAVLRTAVHSLVARHPLLRSAFVEDGGTIARWVANEPAPGCFQHEADGVRDDSLLAERLREAGQRRFALDRGPLFRVHLWTTNGGEAVLLLAAHHLVADYASLVILLRELARAYAAGCRGESAALPPVERSYADFVLFQEGWLGSDTGAARLAYWRDRLAGIPLTLALPTEWPHGAAPASEGRA